MLTEQQWKLRLGMYKSGMIDFEDIYGTIVEQCTEASNGAKPIVSGSLPFTPTDDYINELWEERNSGGTYLEGNLCRREGAKFIRDLMLGGNHR